jgi:hypothetical protein
MGKFYVLKDLSEIFVGGLTPCLTTWNLYYYLSFTMDCLTILSWFSSSNDNAVMQSLTIQEKRALPLVLVVLAKEALLGAAVKAACNWGKCKSELVIIFLIKCRRMIYIGSQSASILSWYRIIVILNQKLTILKLRQQS